MDTRSRADALLLQGFPPVTTRDARVLVLGSMPGVASLEANRYYAHPRNAFWPIMGALVGADPALPYARRLARLKAAGIALWDVLDRCEREGSLDSAIRDAEPNDLPRLLIEAPRLEAIAHNGGESARSMKRSAALGVPVYRLPSSSPANASWSLERKIEAWREVLMKHGIA